MYVDNITIPSITIDNYNDGDFSYTNGSSSCRTNISPTTIITIDENVSINIDNEIITGKDLKIIVQIFKEKFPEYFV